MGQWFESIRKRIKSEKMAIKYLLNGRLSSDIKFLRNFVDSWIGDRKFPEVINNINEIAENDIVIIGGYLGNTRKLIKKHDPQKIFIIDNAIFPSKGVGNFRILDGNLKSLQKKRDQESIDFLYYKNCLNASRLSLNKEDKLISKPKKDFIIEFPWSKQIYKLGKFTSLKNIHEFEKNQNKLIGNKNFKKINMFKKGAILFVLPNDFPLIRMPKFLISYKKKSNIILHSKFLICPNSTLCYLGFVNKKNTIISKFNPFYNWLENNKNYKDKETEEIINSLSEYLTTINFNTNDIFSYIEEKIL